MPAVFYVDACVFGMPALTDSWVNELRDALSRARYIFPLETVIVTPPILSATVRRRVGLFAPDDLVGSSRPSPVGLSGAVVLDANVRAVRGVDAGWLLAVDANRDRLTAARAKLCLLPIGAFKIEPPLVDDIEAVLYEYARKSGAGW